MANSFKALTLALFLCLGGTAHAGYAQAIPPQGWSTAGFKATAANGASFFSGGVRANAVINVGGRSVTLPASMRFASNAPRFAAAAIYLHPGLRTAAAIATWLGIAGLVYDATSGLWTKPDEEGEFSLSDGYRYCNNFNGFCSPNINLVINDVLRYYPDSPYYDGSYFSGGGKYVSHTLLEFSNGFDLRISNYRNNYTYVNSVYIYKSGTSDCPAGWYVTPAGCIQNRPVKTIESEEEFLDRLAPHPMPEEVPMHISEPLPVELPEISPVFVPTGDPILNPKYNPQAEPTPENQPWIQPGVRVQPSPTPDQPWRVDLQPQNRPKTDSTPLPDVQPDIGSQNPPGTEPANPGLCDQYPDILACAKLEEPEEEKLPEVKISEEFDLMDGFYSVATCPVFPQIDMLPGLSWQPFCDQLARIRPLVLAFAWLSAVMIILKYGRK